MPKLKCIVVDDEPIALRIIESYIQKVDHLEFVASCNDAITAFQELQKNEIDLMFLDINMPEMKGTDLIKTIKSPPQVIFTTAYSEYAIESYELNAVDYLLKPISFERFLKAIDKVHPKSPTTVASKKDDDIRAFVFIKAKRKHIKLFYDDILFVESRGHYLHIKTTGEEVTILMKISEIEKQLPENQFTRTHRSFIVNLNKVTAYTLKNIELGVNRIPIGDHYRKHVLSNFNES